MADLILLGKLSHWLIRLTAKEKMHYEESNIPFQIQMSIFGTLIVLYVPCWSSMVIELDVHGTSKCTTSLILKNSLGWHPVYDDGRVGK